jgi:hypothetical protein
MTRNKFVALLSVTVLAFASMAVAQHQHGQPALDQPKTGELTLAEPAVVGTTTLQPGIYEVRHLNGESGHYVQFARRSDQPSDGGETGQGFYSWNVVAKVPCTMEALNARAGQTSLQTSGDTIAQVSSLKIRGEKVAHLF